MDGDLFGFDLGFGGGCGGGYGGAPMAAMLPPPGAVPNACPPQAMQGWDPCDPRIQMALKAAYAKQQGRLAGAQRGALAKAAAGQPAIPVGIGTTGVPSATNPLVPAGAAFTFSVTPFNGDDYCFIDLDVGRATGANFFLITNVTIGRYSVINDPVGIPADTVASDAIHPLLELGATSCQGTFSITVFNTDTVAQRFNGTLWGIPRFGYRNIGPCL